MLRAMGDLGIEIQFADGKRVVDREYVGPIREATNGAPERFTFKDAMSRIGRVFEKNHLRAVQEQVIRSHFG